MVNGSAAAGSGPALPSVLDRLLAEVRAGSEEHRRTWGYHSDPDTPPPWSDADEHALDAFDLRSLGSAATELDRVRAQLRDVGAELARLTREAVGDTAATMCARLSASSHGRADAADALAGELRGAGGRVDELLDGVARRVLRVVDADDPPPPWAAPHDRPPPWAPPHDHPPPWTPPHDRPPWAAPWAGPPRDTWAPPTDPPPRYLTLLRTLREEMAEALGALPELLDRADRPTPRAGWVPEPGTGPLLPGTEAGRVEPGYGIRIARLPDYRPPG